MIACENRETSHFRNCSLIIGYVFCTLPVPYGGCGVIWAREYVLTIARMLGLTLFDSSCRNKPLACPNNLNSPSPDPEPMVQWAQLSLGPLHSLSGSLLSSHFISFPTPSHQHPITPPPPPPKIYFSNCYKTLLLSITFWDFSLIYPDTPMDKKFHRDWGRLRGGSGPLWKEFLMDRRGPTLSDHWFFLNEKNNLTLSK